MDLILSCDKLCTRGVAGVATDTVRNDWEPTCSVMSPRGHWWRVLPQLLPQWHTPPSQELHQKHNSWWQ